MPTTFPPIDGPDQPAYLQFASPSDLKPGQKIKQKIHLLVSSYGCIAVSAHHFDSHILVDTMEVEFTVPADFNPIAEGVKALDKQIDTIMDEARRRTAPLHEQKAQLLQISYGGNDVLDAEQPDPREGYDPLGQE